MNRPSAPGGSSPLVQLDHVEARWPRSSGHGDIVALRPTSVRVDPGTAVCVAGRSGSGKTTLLRIASGLQPPSAGTARWCDERVPFDQPRILDQERRAHVAVVPQGGPLVSSLTALENVAVGFLRRRLDWSQRRRAEEALHRVGLTDRADHLPDQLSGGEAQRVSFARALVQDAPLLVVDEPTASLDRTSADEIIDLLLGLVGEHRGLLVASHDPGLIRRCPQVVELA